MKRMPHNMFTCIELIEIQILIEFACWLYYYGIVRYLITYEYISLNYLIHKLFDLKLICFFFCKTDKTIYSSKPPLCILKLLKWFGTYWWKKVLINTMCIMYILYDKFQIEVLRCLHTQKNLWRSAAKVNNLKRHCDIVMQL